MLDKEIKEATELKRGITIAFRITKDEERKLKELCKGVKISRYIRAGLFGYPQPQSRPIVPRINRTTYIELEQINEKLSRLIDRLAVEEFDKNWQEQVIELSKVINKVRQEVTGLDRPSTDEDEEDKAGA